LIQAQFEVLVPYRWAQVRQLVVQMWGLEEGINHLAYGRQQGRGQRDLVAKTVPHWLVVVLG